MQDLICVRPRFVVWTGDGYEISGHPGVGLCALDTSRQTTDADFDHYDEMTKNVEGFDVIGSCTLGDLKAMMFKRLEIDVRVVSESVARSLYLSSGGEICRCDNESMTVREALSWFDDPGRPYALVRLSRVAGEVLKGELDGVRFFIWTKEQGHCEPHVHVDYHHDAQVVIDLRTLDALESSGRMPGRVRRKINQLIFDQKNMLIKYWNARTNGLDFDVNTGLRLSELSDAVPR